MPDKHRRVRSAAVTGVGQLLGLVGSTLIGVLVAGTLKPSPRVDAFFAANQIYALALYLGQAVRITAPALMVRSGLKLPSLNRATLGLAGGTVATLVMVSILGQPLVAPNASSSFTSDLLILTPAAGVHVISGGMAARLAVLGSFGYSAAAYAAGSVMSGILLLIFIRGSGPSALAPCIAAGGLTIGAIMVASFRQVESRGQGETKGAEEIVGPGPLRAELLEPPTAVFALRRIGLGAVPALAMQLLITVVTLSAGHVVAGGTALLSYSFLALFAFTTIAITPMSIVLGPEVAKHWDGNVDELIAITRQATRLSVVFIVPLVALAFLVGRPIAGILLTALTRHELDEVFAMLAVLCPSLLLTAAATAATVGITAADRLGRLSLGLGAVGIAAIGLGVELAHATRSLLAVAAVAAALSLAYSVVTLYVAVGKRAPGTLAAILADNVSVIAPSMVATAVLATVAKTDLAAGAAAAIAVAAIHVAVVLSVRRDTVILLIGAVRRRQVA